MSASVKAAIVDKIIVYFIIMQKKCLFYFFPQQMGPAKTLENMEAISQSYLVELSVLAQPGQDAVREIVYFLLSIFCRKFPILLKVFLFFQQMGPTKTPENMEAISQSYLVELSVLAPPGQDAIGEDMRLFAEQLRPLVQLEKVDYKRLPLPMGP